MHSVKQTLMLNHRSQRAYKLLTPAVDEGMRLLGESSDPNTIRIDDSYYQYTTVLMTPYVPPVPLNHGFVAQHHLHESFADINKSASTSPKQVPI